MMDLKFVYNGDKTEVTCSGITDMDFEGEVVIPETYNGVPVVEIGYLAFSKSKITSVRIPRNLRTIGMQAFAYCPKLSSVTFDEDSCLDTINPMAFSGCDALKYIRLPKKLHVIEHMAFYDCKVELPNGCVVMSPNFEGCNVIGYDRGQPPKPPVEYDERGNKFRLNESRDGYIAEKIRAVNRVITVPSELNGLPVVELGDFAFSGNEEAWRTYIPATVKKAGYFPFYGCDEMSFADFDGTVDEWRKMDIYTWFYVHCKDGVIKEG